MTIRERFELIFGPASPEYLHLQIPLSLRFSHLSSASLAFPLPLTPNFELEPTPHACLPGRNDPKNCAFLWFQTLPGFVLSLRVSSRNVRFSEHGTTLRRAPPGRSPLRCRGFISGHRRPDAGEPGRPRLGRHPGR